MYTTLLLLRCTLALFVSSITSLFNFYQYFTVISRSSSAVLTTFQLHSFPSLCMLVRLPKNTLNLIIIYIFRELSLSYRDSFEFYLCLLLYIYSSSSLVLPATCKYYQHILCSAFYVIMKMSSGIRLLSDTRQSSKGPS